MIANRARRQLIAVADDIVLKSLDRQRVLRVERFKPALRHRERIMAEFDFARLFIFLIHREIDDPAEETVDVLFDQPELFAQ